MPPVPPQTLLTRAEFEARMLEIQTAMRSEFAAVRREHAEANARQDEEWNKGFRALRGDFADGIDTVREDLRNFVTNDVFVARLTPVQAVAYGLVALLMSLMTGMLAMSLMGRKG